MPTPFKCLLYVILGGAWFVSGVTAYAGTDTWAGSAGSTDWATAVNWGGTAPVSATAVAYTQTGNDFTLGTATAATSLTNSSANLQTINDNIVLGNNTQTFALTSGGVTLGGNVTSTGRQP